MLTVGEITAFLRSRGVTEPVNHSDDQQEMPDEMLYVSATGGPGAAREYLFEVATFQILARGRQNDLASTEALADRVDRALIDAIPPFTIGGRHVVALSWVGGPPAVVDRDDARRYIASANYWMDLAR